MKIAFAIRDRKNFIGGPAADAVRLLRLFHGKGHEVHVLGVWVGDEEVHEHFDALREAGIPCGIVKRHRYTEDGVGWMLQQLREIQPDIFVSGLSTEGCFTSRWLRKAGIPVVNILYGNDPVNLGRAMYFTDCAPVWRVSAHVVFGQSLMSNLLSRAKHTLPAVVVSGVVEMPVLQAQYIHHHDFSIVYAGRLVENQKRTGDMINAFIRLCSRYPNFYFHLIGDSIANERDCYEQMVNESGYEKRILFHGILHGKAYFDELAKHQVIILLSDYEGIPGSVIDGMATGLVPVCLRYPGVEDLVTHGESGLIVDDRSESLEHALTTLSTEDQLWKKLATNARNIINENFSQNVVFDKWEKFLGDLVKNSPSHHEIRIPKRIRLPRKNKLLIEDKRKPTMWDRILSRVTRAGILCAIICALFGCARDESAQAIANDKDAALHHLKKQFILKPFDAYHLLRVPDAKQCLSLLDDDGVFTDTRSTELEFLQNLDSFYRVESASYAYSKFLMQSISRLWQIAEQYRNQKHPDPDDLTKLYRGIAHYGKLEIDRPGNLFQHMYSDFHISAAAINMYFCLYPMMEVVRLEQDPIPDLQRNAYRYLTEMGQQSWTVPAKSDSTDAQPFQLDRFSGNTWWINGNALEFRPGYACALMMHSAEMVDIISVLAEHAVTMISATTVDTAFWREGLTPDGGSWTYGRQNRIWTYPFRGVRAAVQRMAEFKGTPWEIPMTPSKANVLMEFIRGSSFFHYKGYVPPNQDKQNFNYGWMSNMQLPSIRIAKLLVQDFSDHFSNEELDELHALIEHGSDSTLFETPILTETYTGSRYFYCNDDLLRKTSDYYALINMASRRTDGVASTVHLADYYNFFGADGATFFMRKGNEYHLAHGAYVITSYPGVTARQGDQMLIPGRNLMGHCSLHNIAAGLVTESGSCAGFVFEKMRGLDKYKSWALADTAFENDQPWLYGVTAHKSYFWFGDQLVALGCGISNKRPDFNAEIHTTIDQTLFQGHAMVGGQDVTLGDSSIARLIKTNGTDQRASSVTHHGFVFEIIPEQTPGSAHLLIQSRPTRWDELNRENQEVRNKPLSMDIFQLWINHGKQPVNDRYGYQVYCGKGNPPPSPVVLSNTTSMQAVASEDCTHVQAIFYQTDTLLCAETLFHVSAPCAFSARFSGDQLRLSVSDAQMDVSLDTIVITTNLPLLNAKRVGEEHYQIAIALPTGLYRGQQGDAVFELRR